MKYSDKLIRESMEKNIKLMPMPSEKEMLSRIMHELYAEDAPELDNEEHGKKYIIYLLAAVIVLLLMLAGGLLLAGQGPAIQEKVANWLVEEKETGTTSEEIKDNSGENGNAQQEDNTINEKKSDEFTHIVHSFSEVKKYLPDVYEVEPKYIPKGFVFKDIWINSSGGASEIVVSYKSIDGSKKDLTLRQSDSKLPGSDDYGDDATVKKVDINGNEGSAISYDNNSSIVVWRWQGKEYTIDSPVNAAESLKMARSIQ